MVKEAKRKQPDIRVKSTPPFKLKDKTPRRRWQAINLKKQFGFIPEVIIIEKVWGRNNALIVRAVLTPEEIKKEDKMRAKFEKAKKSKLKVKPLTKEEMEKRANKSAKKLEKKGGEK